MASAARLVAAAGQRGLKRNRLAGELTTCEVGGSACQWLDELPYRSHLPNERINDYVYDVIKDSYLCLKTPELQRQPIPKNSGITVDVLHLPP